LERFQALEHIIRDSPLTVEPYIELAKIYLQNKRWTDARRVLDAAVEKFPEDEDANFLREEAQIARSLQLFGEAQQQFTDEPTELTEQALNRCRIELNGLRERVCKARLARHPAQEELYLPLASALTNQGRVEEAVAYLAKAIANPQLRAPAALQLGQTLEAIHRVPEALQAYRRAALYRVPPPSREIKLQALTAAANLAEKAQLIDSARRYLKLLIQLQPDQVDWKNRYERLANMPL
jgi:tetratricopeptide (TPR) repeat protein